VLKGGSSQGRSRAHRVANLPARSRRSSRRTCRGCTCGGALAAQGGQLGGRLEGGNLGERANAFSPERNQAIANRQQYWDKWRGDNQGKLTNFCAAPRFFVGTGEVQRRIISWELARGAQRNLTKGQL
jgi:hypothetical protein